jgi:hypothetical protein
MERALLRRGCLTTAIILIAAALLVPFQGMIWDGGFNAAEYRLVFIDGSGRPVPGVKLKVLTKAGEPSHFYPIDEFTPEDSAVSDASGRMLFHHAGDELEFSGREYQNLVGMRFGETKAPQYVLVFMIGDREVHRVRHDEIRPRGELGLPIVRRMWAQQRATPARAVADGDDRETRTAIGYASRDHEAEREIEFKLVERTITIVVP